MFRASNRRFVAVASGGLGRIVKETQAVPQTGEAAPVWQYQYDADSELTQVTNPLGLTQTSTFNGLGQ